MPNATLEEASAEAPSEIEVLRARIAELESLLMQKDAPLQGAFRMPPMLTNLLGLLLTMPYVDESIAKEKVGIVSNLKVTMHRLRMELKPHGIEVENRKQAGYWLSDEAKNRIREIIAQKSLH